MSEGRVAWNHVGSRIMGNPFQSDGRGRSSPFGELFEKWCPRCKMVVDSDTNASHRAGMYFYKTTCNRCGKVIEYGAYAAPIIQETPVHAFTFPRLVFEWVNEKGRDRR